MDRALKRMIRWLMLGLACLALGAGSVPARAAPSAEIAAVVALLERAARRDSAATAMRRERREVRSESAPRALRPVSREPTRSPRLFLENCALLC